MDRGENGRYFKLGRLMSAYNQFSIIYDELMDPSYYDKWLEYTTANLPNKGSILELGCGSGKLAALLSHAGYQITGLDSSSDMLTLAQRHKEVTGQSFKLVQGSMTDLKDFGTYDHVISFNDTICYLRTPEEVLKTFNQVYQVLNSGGCFLFDVHSPKKMNDFIGYSYHGESENGLLIWDSFQGSEDHSIEHDLSIFTLMEGHTYERFDERHYERTYPLNVYKEMLEQAGFNEVEPTSDFKDTFNEHDGRWFFKAVK